MPPEPPDADPPKRQRRWFQFSLRTLMIVVLICAIPCTLIKSRIDRKHREREVIKAIELLPGEIRYDYQGDVDAPFDEKAEPSGPAWLRNLLGQDFFSEVNTVNLLSSEIGDRGLVNVKELSQVQSLGLDFIWVTDAGLVNIKDLPRLRILRLGWTDVTDAGLVNLKGLTALRELNLLGTRVTEAGVNNLRNALPNCKILSSAAHPGK